MQVQLNTDKNISGTENLQAAVTEELENGLKHFTDHLTRVEVHLSDQNADKAGPDDIKCKLEARIEGMKPVLVESKSSSKEKALAEAIDKLKGRLKTIIGKRQNK